MKKRIKYLIEYPCKEPFHEFQLVPPYQKGLCECLYCNAKTDKKTAELYSEYKRKNI